MAKKMTQEEYAEKIEALDAKIVAEEAKIADIRVKVTDLKIKKAELELAKEKAWNDEVVIYLKNHKNADGSTYYESFSETMVRQKETGKEPKNVVDEPVTSATSTKVPRKRTTK